MITYRGPLKQILAFWLTASFIWAAEGIPNIAGVEARVYFSPNGGCTDAIVHEIENAKTDIHVQAYSFTSKPIQVALRNAKGRGLDVSVILDASQRTEKYSGADFIAHGGISVVIDEKPAIAHSKVMIIDQQIVITGSFNFTSAAESKNVENLLILRSELLAKEYLKNWNARHTASVPFLPKDERK